MLHDHWSFVCLRGTKVRQALKFTQSVTAYQPDIQTDCLATVRKCQVVSERLVTFS